MAERLFRDGDAGRNPAGRRGRASWDVLNHLGERGYRDVASRLSTLVDAYVAGIEALGMRMIARPDFSIINYITDDFDIFRVAEAMAGEGWLPGLTRRPRGMHAMAKVEATY